MLRLLALPPVELQLGEEMRIERRLSGDRFTPTCVANMDDRVFSFEIPEQGQYRVQITPEARASVVSIRSNCADDGTSQIFCQSGDALQDALTIDAGSYVLIIDDVGEGISSVKIEAVSP